MNTYIIEGGIGKQVAFTAIIDALVKKDKEKIRRIVVSFLKKPFPPLEGFDFGEFYARDVKSRKKRMGKTFIDSAWQT